MHQLQDEATIKLHVADDGCVWYAKGINVPQNSGQQINEFLNSNTISGLGMAFRLLGVARNAALICALHLRRYKGEVRAVEIAGPNILDCRQDLDCPTRALQKMRAAKASPAAGGWHRLNMHDYPTYAMLSRLAENKYVFDESAESYFQMHPAYKALTFIPTLSPESITYTLTTIVDPRWYIDQRRPERIKKLELFLGLIPSVQAQVSDEKKLKKERQFRCLRVLHSWKTRPENEVDLQDPANFLYRIYIAAGRGPRGDLRASQCLLRYVNDNWLAALDTRKGARDELFAADLFFKTPAEISAYKKHMKSAK